jgi:RimJ/RimL family protein N-acetyltransferase
MPPVPVLHTQRLVLRPVRSKDAPVIQWRFPKWEIVRWLDAHVPWPYPADGAATFVAACLEEMARGENAHWAIVPRSGPADLIGSINLRPHDDQGIGQIGFWLDPAFQGHGLMTETAGRVIDYALRDLGWSSLCITNAQENLASRRVQEKQGARLIDLGIGHFVCGRISRMVWLLDRDDWLARHPSRPGKKEGRRLATSALDSVAANRPGIGG